MTWSEEQALVEILRGRMEGLGPVTETALTAALGVGAGRSDACADRAGKRRRDPAGPLRSGRQ